MTKKWIAITLLLLVVTGLLAWQLHNSVRSFNTKNDLSKLLPERTTRQKAAQEKLLPRLVPPANHASSEFSIIPDKNVFSDTRSKEDSAEATAPSEPMPLTQKPILVGTSIVDNMKRASVIDPTSAAQSRNRRAQTKRIGDVYHGFTITDIAPNHIVLESGTRKEIIPLHEGSKRSQGGKTAILPTRVVSIGGGSVGGGMPVSVVSSSAAPQRAAAAPTTSPAAGATSSQTVIGLPVGVPQRTTPTTAQQPTQQPQPKQQVVVPTTETDAQGRRIIRTPFGNIVRPNQE